MKGNLRMTRFEEQMKKLHDGEYANVWPNRDWKMEDYECMFYYIERGYLVQSSEDNTFEINEEWEGDPLWEE